MPIQTLQYGWQQPQNGDGGALFFPAMNANITQLASHIHDGVTSALVPTITQAISSANWVANGSAVNSYKQTITLPTSPAALLFASTLIELRDSSGNKVYNQIDGASTTTYVVYTNDNTQNLTAYYK
jgi:hypothetical protein